MPLDGVGRPVVEKDRQVVGPGSSYARHAWRRSWSGRHIRSGSR
jgi:hypothetical protein